MTQESMMYCVEFWDGDPAYGRWNERANTRRSARGLAIALAQSLNRTENPQANPAFSGHRFRVRKVRTP